MSTTGTEIEAAAGLVTIVTLGVPFLVRWFVVPTVRDKIDASNRQFKDELSTEMQNMMKPIHDKVTHLENRMDRHLESHGTVGQG